MGKIKSYRGGMLAASALAALGAAVSFDQNTLAVQTNYAVTPAAIVANDGLLWDNQFAQIISTDAAATGKTNASIVWVGDFCYSGGFVDDVAALNGGTNNYAASAAAWSETSTSLPGEDGDIAPFGQQFMISSETNTLGQSFTTAAANVAGEQTPQQIADASAPTSLAYQPGDEAIIFSAGDTNGLEGSFWTDVGTAYNALTTRPSNAWTAGSVQVLWDQGQTTGTYGASYVSGASTISNLKTAISNVYNNDSFGPNNTLFIYMNDHGTNTDVLKSKITANVGGGYLYNYEATTANYFNGGANDRNNYGIWSITINTLDKNVADFSNFNLGNLPAGWTASLSNGTIFLDGSPNNSATWLLPGTNYDFGFDNIHAPFHASWNTWLNNKNSKGNYLPSDGGGPNGSAWGYGYTVFDQQQLNANDPSQWPGWDNGGDGWVEAPVPEPANLALLAISGAGLLLIRQQRSRTIRRVV
ncbi:MAG: PEP-CTERM sorting domain-containing protein [Planctomycetia bacterium]|nr:PEP-CTERM sorting domain-containing protein [Planctomycetia bacterium]